MERGTTLPSVEGHQGYKAIRCTRGRTLAAPPLTISCPIGDREIVKS